MKIIWLCVGAMFVLLAACKVAFVLGMSHVALTIGTLATLPVAVTFYRMRLQSRLWYGCFELAVSLGFFYFLVANFYENEKPFGLDLITGRILTIFAAIYFMVRALENIGVGLQGSKYEKRWLAVFPPTNGGRA
jgi:phosphate/sulfate permease